MTEEYIRMMVGGILDKKIEQYISHRIQSAEELVEKKIADGLLDKLKEEIRKENEAKFERLDILSNIVLELGKLLRK
jgi:hypothetical protein